MKLAGILDRRVRGRISLMGLTQREFCKIVGVSYVTFRAWMSRWPNMPVADRERLCGALCVTNEWLDSESLEDAGDGLNALCIHKKVEIR